LSYAQGRDSLQAPYPTTPDPTMTCVTPRFRPVLRRALPAVMLLAASGCCRWNDEPNWVAFGPLYVGEDEVQVDLSQYIEDDRGALVFEASSQDEGLIAWADGEDLRLQAQPDWQEGATAVVDLLVEDRCGATRSYEVDVIHGEEPIDDTGAPDTDEPVDTYDPDTPVNPCAVSFEYWQQGSPEAVYVAGPFNDWSTSSHPMEHVGDGLWTVDIELEPGAHPYKFVEVSGASQGWACDPNAELIQCDEGYKEPSDTRWQHDCSLNASSCNSMVRVGNCTLPLLELEDLSIDRGGMGVSATVGAWLGAEGGEIVEAVATLDGEAIEGAWTGQAFEVELSGLEPSRHTLRFRITDEDGYSSKEVYVPFWLDGVEWDGGLMYYAFIDRVSNGDPSIDGDEGASWELGSYMGGDFQGLIDMLPYLDDLGVTVIWIANPQDNAEGAFSADCGSYSGYHGYWPDAARTVEEHYGDEAKLKELVDLAHARGMRVLMDWVVNHVHEDHPYYQNHRDDDWFNPLETCKVGDDYSNFDRIPETCWFAEYLPDIKFYNPDPLNQMIEDAIWWIKEYELDGFRVDAAKHVPMSVTWNLAGRLEEEIEHRGVGGDEDFYTVGETFTSSYDLINLYVGDHLLDAQFDFPLYYGIRAAFADYSCSMADLFASRAASDAAYGGAVMSQFMGNHDVSRFLSYASAGGWADSNDSMCLTGEVDGNGDLYAKLRLAWTFLMTQPGIPLIYYGDELGIPGYKDPSNRGPLWWYASALGEGEVDLVDVASSLNHPAQHEDVLWHVAELGAARREHPAMYSGTTTQWWEEEHLYAFGRSTGGDHVLVIINRADQGATLSNGLAYMGLPASGSYEDVLTGETFNASGDNLTVSVGGYQSRVLIPR
jgi:glycosidase